MTLDKSKKRRPVIGISGATGIIALAADKTYSFHDIGAAIASGSFKTLGMVVIPCSMKILSGIANCYSENLLLRAADVTLKEQRQLVLSFRETPLHSGHIRLMRQASEMGAILAPPMPAFYIRPASIQRTGCNGRDGKAINVRPL